MKRRSIASVLLDAFATGFAVAAILPYDNIGIPERVILLFIGIMCALASLALERET